MWVLTIRQFSYFLSLYAITYIFDSVNGNESFSGNISDATLSEFNLSNGFGDHIVWHSMEDSSSESSKNEKPLMIIIYKSECGACQAFKKIFKDSLEVMELSRFFTMINIRQNDVKDSNLSPDGTYVPRVLFLDSKRNVHYEIYNKKGNSEYKYFYPKIPHLVESMKRAITMFGTITASDEL